MMLLFFEIFLLVSLLSLLVSLMLNIRIRLKLSSVEKVLFVGLGRSGADLDFIKKTAVLKLFGGRVRSFSIAKRDKSKGIKEKISEALNKREESTQEISPKKKDASNLSDLWNILPDSIKPLWRYMVGIFKGVKVEEAVGEISGGFDSPDITGQAFGYYQAAQAALPSVFGRVNYKPDWEGASIDGFLKLSLAMPAYRLVAETILLVFRLPVIKIWKLAIAK